jgi:hypothetical protein
MLINMMPQHSQISNVQLEGQFASCVAESVSVGCQCYDIRICCITLGYHKLLFTVAVNVASFMK